MSAALAMKTETAEAAVAPRPMGEVVELRPEQIVDAPTAAEVEAEARLGIERLRTMTPDELRQVITRRVELLENVLREREERATAIEEGMLAQRVLEMRRQRAQRIRHKVNIGSSLIAAMFTGIIVAGMF